MNRQERLNHVKDMFFKNIRTKDIAKKLNVSDATISNDIRHLGLKGSTYLNIRIKEMYSNGKTIAQISFELDVSKTYVSAVVKNQGFKKQHYVAGKKNLIDENTVFTNDSVKLEKLVVGGKRYLDITPVFAPR